MSTRNRFRMAWLAGLLAFVALFIVVESMALNDADGLTLSRLVYDAWHAWPLFGPLLGIGVGILLSHFFWEWSPKLQAAEKRIEELEAEIAQLKR